VDAILELYMNVADGLVVYPNVVKMHVEAELPFMATENIMMDAVKDGGDRQELHEKIRVHSMEAAKMVKEFGRKNDLIDRIASDPSFGKTLEELNKILDPEKFTGRSPEQVVDFMEECINPILEANKNELGIKADINL
jgi:adenylosuccinate lyase